MGVRQENEGHGYEQSTKLHVEECYKTLFCVVSKSVISSILLNTGERVHCILCGKTAVLIYSCLRT